MKGMQQTYRVFILIILGVIPSLAFADVNADIAAQTAALQKQVQALEQQLGASGASATAAKTTSTGVTVDSSSCPNIGRSLKPGSSGNDVARLQAFLAKDSSIYPEATVSGYFGALTKAAVQRWQVKYNIVSSGTPETTGYGMVGPRTAAAIALLCSTMSSSGSAGGYITVSPTAGNTPLTVTVTANVNTTLSCATGVYTLDYGDGTQLQQIVVPPNSCKQATQNFTHIYIYGGTYKITLASGSHQTSATVTVSGPAAPGSTGGSTGTTPKGTLSAFVTGGNAPLTTTFYVSCVGGSIYNVVFGDGSDLGSTGGIAGATCNGGLQSITHTYQNSGSYTAQLVIFVPQSNGTLLPMQFGSVGITVGGATTSGGGGSGGTGISNYSYSPPTLTPNISGNPLAVTISFDLPAACTGYDVSWGDGSADTTQSDGGSSCSYAPTTRTLSHQYATSGSYTVTLYRGAGLVQRDTVAISISN